MNYNLEDYTHKIEFLGGDVDKAVKSYKALYDTIESINNLEYKKILEFVYSSDYDYYEELIFSAFPLYPGFNYAGGLLSNTMELIEMWDRMPKPINDNDYDLLLTCGLLQYLFLLKDTGNIITFFNGFESIQIPNKNCDEVKRIGAMLKIDSKVMEDIVKILEGDDKYEWQHLTLALISEYVELRYHS